MVGMVGGKVGGRVGGNQDYYAVRQQEVNPITAESKTPSIAREFSFG
jgi:hypothetical protein